MSFSISGKPSLKRLFVRKRFGEVPKEGGFILLSYIEKN